MGLICAIFCYSDLIGSQIDIPDNKTAIGSLLNYITIGSNQIDFQPMNVNFGLFEPLKLTKKIAKKDRKIAYSNRAVESLKIWYKNNVKFLKNGLDISINLEEYFNSFFISFILVILKD